MPKLKPIDAAEAASIVSRSDESFEILSDAIYRFENNGGFAFEPTEQLVMDMVIRAEAFSTFAKILLRQRRLDASSRELAELRARAS